MKDQDKKQIHPIPGWIEMEAHERPVFQIARYKEPVTEEKLPRKSGAQRKREWRGRERVLDKGIWRLGIWQPHPRVGRGRPRQEAK